MNFKILFLLLITFILLFSCQNQTENKTTIEKTYSNHSEKLTAKSMTEKQDTALSFFVQQTIESLAKKDFDKLASLADQNGIRFSPYVNISKDDLIILSSDINSISDSDSLLHWGIYDGSGEDIKLSFNAYFKRFIYSQNFIDIEPNYNQTKASGNNINNIKEFYPNSTVVEFYFPGTKKYEQMDWKALYLVFSKQNHSYKLKAIIHNQWTI